MPVLYSPQWSYFKKGSKDYSGFYVSTAKYQSAARSLCFILTWVFLLVSNPGVGLLGGPEPACWPSEGTWVLSGTEGRARADGLLGFWGIGRALCTGLGLGSPDFIFEPTRMAGIFSLVAWCLHAPLPPTLRWKSCWSGKLVFDHSHMIQLFLLMWRCRQIKEMHVQFAYNCTWSATWLN